MTVDSPILGLAASAILLAVIALTRRYATAVRWLLRGGACAAAVAVAGVNLRCERPLNVAVMIDVSPSTRGAAFRDAPSVRARLTPLLAGRPYAAHYFADGEQPTANEPTAERTRLEAPPDADAIVLMSDGRFPAPAGLPPTFAVIDPALDSPADARVRDARRDADGLLADVVSAGPDRPLRIEGRADAVRVAAGPAVVMLPTAGLSPGATVVGFAHGDRWPENDSLGVAPAARPARRLSVGVALPGFERITPDRQPTGREAADVTAIIVDTTSADGGPLHPTAATALERFLRDFGGTVVFAGPPDAVPASMRGRTPLAATPPAGPNDWVVLLDASGSMAAAVGESAAGRASLDPPAADAAAGRTRWQTAVRAARQVVRRLPDGARVTVMRFAGDARTIAVDADARTAELALDAEAARPPSGPTGLRAALRSIAEERRANAAGPARVLLLTDGDADLGDTAELADRLNAAHLMIDAVTSTAAGPLAELTTRTGGRAATNVYEARWAAALGGLAARASPVVDHAERWTGHGELAGTSGESARRWPAFVRSNATVVAGDAATPVAAVGQAWGGRVVSVVAELAPIDLAALAVRLERPASDPRFTTAFDERTRRVRLSAFDAAGPMNGLSPTLTGGPSEVRLDAVGPGTYEATLPREADWAVVRVDGVAVARQALAGRYAVEFDAIGNDRTALAALAQASGGAVIEAGDVRPIALPRRYASWPTRGTFAVTAAGLLLAGVAAGRKAIFSPTFPAGTLP